jgi:hypothetical protein
MALFRFRTRSSQRDRDTDIERLRRLQQSIVDMRAEMERKRNGLRDRYDRVTADAAFSQQRLEDGRGGDGASSKIDGMTGAMIRYTKRMASLQSQINFVTEIGRKVEAFPRASAEDRAVA